MDKFVAAMLSRAVSLSTLSNAAACDGGSGIHYSIYLPEETSSAFKSEINQT
ncbi:MAG: hypothetical protein ABFD91_07730 [Anaerohalosphaeraceae bacterium]